MHEEHDDFTAFVEARLDRWRRTAYLLCRDWHGADDLVSIAVGKIYRHWRRVRAMQNVDAYAQRVLTRAWLDETRRPWRRESPAHRLPDSPAPADGDLADRQALWQMLETLGPRQRAVVVLRFYLDMTVEETAEVLGITAGTVKSQSARALERLRALELR